MIMCSQYLMPCQSSFTRLDSKIWGCSLALGENWAHACAPYPWKHADAFIWCLIQQNAQWISCSTLSMIAIGCSSCQPHHEHAALAAELPAS